MTRRSLSENALLAKGLPVSGRLLANLGGGGGENRSTDAEGLQVCGKIGVVVGCQGGRRRARPAGGGATTGGVPRRLERTGVTYGPGFDNRGLVDQLGT